MRKFSETYAISSYEIGIVFPEYSDLFEKLEDIDAKVRRDGSSQAKEEYINLVQSVDDFLNRPENLQKFVDEGILEPEDIELSKTTETFSEEEARDRLTREIEEATKDVDPEQLQEQIDLDIEKAVKDESLISEKPLTRGDAVSEGDEFFGVQFKYFDVKRDQFARCLSMLKSGCKFYFTEFASKHYVLFKLPNREFLIIEKSIPTQRYNDIFGAGDNNLCFIVAPTLERLEKLYQIFKYAISSDYEEYASVPKIDDDYLFNSPIMRGAYKGFLYDEAQKLAQTPEISNNDNYLKIYFSWFFSMEKILTLVNCNEKYNQTGVSSTIITNQIKDDIVNKTFRFEGIGDVPHSQNILKKLKSDNFLTDDFKVSAKAVAPFQYNKIANPCNPAFRPFMYYRVDVKEQFEKAKTKMYSQFDGTTVFHINKDINGITIALPLPGKFEKEWGYDKAKQEDIFPQEWQSQQEFNTWVEYLPFASLSNVKVMSRSAESDKRKYLKGKINFADEYKYKLYIASTQDPSNQFQINSSVYNYIVQMYKDKKVKIVGPDVPSFQTTKRKIFFKLVDENDNLLAVLPTITKMSKSGTSAEGQQTLDFSTDELSNKQKITPVWDYDELLSEFTRIAPDFIKNGADVESASELDNTIYPEAEEELLEPAKEEIKEDEDMQVISLDEPEEEEISEEVAEEIVEEKIEEKFTEEVEDAINKELEEQLQNLPEDVDAYIEEQEKEDLEEFMEEKIEERKEEPQDLSEEEEEQKEGVEEEVKQEPGDSSQDEIRKQIDMLNAELDSPDTSGDRIDDILDELLELETKLND